MVALVGEDERLRRALTGVAVHGVLGRGRGGLVLEVSKKRRGVRFAAKVFRGSLENARREYELARWAAERSLGPRVFPMECDSDTHPVLWMDLLPLTLGTSFQADYAQARAQWQSAFALLEEGNFATASNGAEVWLCCDDLKPHNIVFSARDASFTRLVDWDPRHWHGLPLLPREGRFLNQLFLILNSALPLCAPGPHSLAQLHGLWPEREAQRLLALCALAEHRDRALLTFLQVLDPLMRKGPYHYAGASERQGRTWFLAHLTEMRALLHPSGESSPANESIVLSVRSALRRISAGCKGSHVVRRRGSP